MLFFAQGRKVVQYFSAQGKKIFFLPRAEKYCTTFSPSGINFANRLFAIEVKKIVSAWERTKLFYLASKLLSADESSFRSRVFDMLFVTANSY